MTSLDSSGAGAAGRARAVALVATPLGGPASQVHPIGALTVGSYVATALGDAVDVVVFNYGANRPGQDRDFARIAAFDPVVVGFPVYSSHVHEVIGWAQRLRELLPHAVFVAGGPHVTLAWTEFVTRWGHVFDLSVSGDGERPMLAVVRAALEGDVSSAWTEPGVGRLVDGRPVLVRAGEPLPVDEWTDPLRCKVIDGGEPLIFTDRRDRRVRQAVALVSSRSCPQKCSFCAIIAMPGGWRAARSDVLVDWLATRHAREPFEHVYFMDANFFVSADRVRELVAELHDRLPDVTWSTSSTVGFLLKMADDMPWLIERGLRGVEIGIESGSPEELRFLNKRVSIERNHQAIALVQRYGLELGLDYIMFYPDQTVDQLRENLVFLREARLLDEEFFGHYLNTLELYPGTPLRAEFERRQGAPFDPDVLPDPEPLFRDEAIRSIYRVFIDDFARQYLPAIKERIAELQRAARATQPDDPAAAQAMRLQTMLLRHVPFKVLWNLCDNPGAACAADALPWLATFDLTGPGILDLVEYRAPASMAAAVVP